ncbi:hypothetical protein RhiirA1_467643 [Rhizophagus irregularis]|uniref:F-box domain-containing protein n=2 Tax=Rhizophagus irregularis TaxID=588596 RepID=A0A2N0RBQ2_9GLOM|nr:hypothetical protein RhiirA1_467643 [Rhizophagus irregularis]
MKKLNIHCLILIFDELRADKKSLYSCLLVNKEWCYLVIPILWKNYPTYFIMISEKSREKFSNIILSCLPKSSKQLLLENNIKLPQTILSKTPTFNYVSLYKFLEAKIINNITNVVFKDFSKKRNLLEQEIYKLFVSQCEGIKELEWQTSQPLPSFPGALTCFSRLYSLQVDLSHVNSNNLYEMAHICKDLGELTICGFSQDVRGLTFLINEQRNLKSITLNAKKELCQELSKVLARKGHTISNLSLVGSFGFISHSFLTSLVNLKKLKVCYCFVKYEEIEEFQEYLANSTFPELQSLEIYYNLLCLKEFAKLIEKTEGNISNISSLSFLNFNSSTEYTGIFLKAISNHCPKIKNLATHIGPEDLKYVKSLLMNCRNLISLNLDSLRENNNNIGDELLDILTKFSPRCLTNIMISGDWKYSIDSFENYFESYRERKSLRFMINCLNGNKITPIHIEVVRKYYEEGIIISSNLIIK